jgi:membrane protein implicated in regulation of membrane protease activity
MNIQELLFDDGAIWFFGIAGIATLLFILTIAMLFMGGDGGLDADSGDASDGAFKVLSFQGIVGFSMGWGWGGLAAYRNLEFTWPQSALFGLAIGSAFLWILWLGFKAMHDLTGDGNIEASDAVGTEGTVTIAIPAEGRGRISVVVRDRQREFKAVSNGKAVASRTAIRVIASHGDGTLEVEPA